MNIEDLVSAIRREYTEFEYDRLIAEYIFTLEGSYSFIVYYQKDCELTETEKSNKAIRETVRMMTQKFQEHKYSDRKFNRVKIIISKDGIYEEQYNWDRELERKNLLDNAEVFYRWVSDRMISMIFEYEKENGLLPLRYDSDGDLEYLSSWDSGVFTFHISSKKELGHRSVLVHNGVERILELNLKDYFVEGILEHHKITHTELADDWKPWNTMILKSLHNDISHDKREDFVSYIIT
ncbi:hypothetical protein SAMN02927916_3931 [Flavobacterium anhuiense]|uniref:Uncharacterized protein n=1 Tax=Flavobacterium anhuiense TaxID=459526 RepID=A0ABY0M585_9FLAO|nr:hypothetical protein [Flavobacterium anhuiense]SCY90400.1 hypothetical protein SAMN02927916_3931 [Flavobacterium anhuiense]